MISKFKKRDFNRSVKDRLLAEFNVALDNKEDILKVFKSVSNKTLLGSAILAHRDLLILASDSTGLPSERLLDEAIQAMQQDNPFLECMPMTKKEEVDFIDAASVLYAYVKNERSGIVNHSKHLLTRYYPIEMYTTIERVRFLLNVGAGNALGTQDFINQFNKLYEAVRVHSDRFGLGTPLVHDEIKKNIIPLIQSNVSMEAPFNIYLLMDKVLIDLKYVLVTDEENLDVEDEFGFVETVAINSDVIKQHTAKSLLEDLLNNNTYGRGTLNMLEVLFEEVPSFNQETIGYAVYGYLHEIYVFLKNGKLTEDNKLEVSSSMLNAMLAVYLDAKSKDVIKEQVGMDLTTTDLHRYANVYEFYSLMGYPRHHITSELMKLAKLLDERRVPHKLLVVREAFLTILDNINKRKEKPTPEFLKGSLLPMIAIHQMKVLRDAYEEYTDKSKEVY